LVCDRCRLVFGNRVMRPGDFQLGVRNLAGELCTSSDQLLGLLCDPSGEIYCGWRGADNRRLPVQAVGFRNRITTGLSGARRRSVGAGRPVGLAVLR
jgi:hypothetical protein